MNADELLVRLATLHSVASEYLTEDLIVEHAKDSNVEGRTVPFTLYDVEIDYDEFYNPIGGQVIPIQVKRYGVNLGCSSPTVDFFDSKSRRTATGKVNRFYLTSEDAQTEIDLTIKIFQREQAQRELNTLIRAYLPYVLESVDTAKLFEQLKQVDD